MKPLMKIMMAATAAAALAMAAGCSTNMGPRESLAKQAQAVDDGVATTLGMLYSSVSGSRQLVGKASGILVFPRVDAAGLVVGGEYGRGALQVAGRTVGYYKMTGVSVGLQAGAESKAVVFVFMTQHALDRFLAGNGWSAGVDASVAVLRAGANGALDTNDLKSDVAAFTLTNRGLMAGATLQGTKVSRLDVPLAGF